MSAVERVFAAFNDQDAEGWSSRSRAGDGSPTRPRRLTPTEYGDYCADLFEAFPDVE